MRTSNPIVIIACVCFAGGLLSGCVSASSHNRVLDELASTRASLHHTTQELENTRATVEQIKRTMTLVSRASLTAAEDVEHAKQSLQSLDRLTSRMSTSVNELAATLDRAIQTPQTDESGAGRSAPSP